MQTYSPMHTHKHPHTHTHTHTHTCPCPSFSTPTAGHMALLDMGGVSFPRSFPCVWGFDYLHLWTARPPLLLNHRYSGCIGPLLSAPPLASSSLHYTYVSSDLLSPEASPTCLTLYQSTTGPSALPLAAVEVSSQTVDVEHLCMVRPPLLQNHRLQ